MFFLLFFFLFFFVLGGRVFANHCYLLKLQLILLLIDIVTTNVSTEDISNNKLKHYPFICQDIELNPIKQIAANLFWTKNKVMIQLLANRGNR